jgi:hypothetical protein
MWPQLTKKKIGKGSRSAEAIAPLSEFKTKCVWGVVDGYHVQLAVTAIVHMLDEYYSDLQFSYLSNR